MLTQSRLKELLDYDPVTGAWRWRINRGGMKAGDMAGCMEGNGYCRLSVDGISYKSSKLAVFYMTGTKRQES